MPQHPDLVKCRKHMRQPIYRSPLSAYLLLLIIGLLLMRPAIAEEREQQHMTPLAIVNAKIDTWNGFKRYTFEVDGCKAWIVEPKKILTGRPWSWCMEFPDAFTKRCAALQLLEAGFYHGHIVVGNTFGCPAAQQHFQAFYKTVSELGLAEKAVLIGLSRGGLYAYRFASENPEKVAVIYGDAPVCDFKSWPGGKGKGKGSPKDWASLLKHYQFPDEAAALAYNGNPIDILPTLAKAKIPLIHVVGDADNVVPAPENTAIMQQRYQALGGIMTVINKPGIGHHPHGLDDPMPVVNFIIEHVSHMPSAPHSGGPESPK